MNLPCYGSPIHALARLDKQEILDKLREKVAIRQEDIRESNGYPHYSWQACCWHVFL